MADIEGRVLHDYYIFNTWQRTLAVFVIGVVLLIVGIVLAPTVNIIAGAILIGLGAVGIIAGSIFLYIHRIRHVNFQKESRFQQIQQQMRSKQSDQVPEISIEQKKDPADK